MLMRMGKEEEPLEQGGRDVMHRMTKFKCIHFEMVCHFQNMSVTVRQYTRQITSAPYLIINVTYVNIIQTVMLRWCKNHINATFCVKT